MFHRGANHHHLNHLKQEHQNMQQSTSQAYFGLRNILSIWPVLQKLKFSRNFFSIFSTKGVESRPRNSLCPWSLIDDHIINQMILSLSWFFGMFDNFNISCFHSVSSFSSNLAMSKKLKLFFKTSFIFVAELWMSATHFRIFAFDDWKFNASHAFCFLPFPVGREPRLGSWTRGDPARLNNFALPCQRLDS